MISRVYTLILCLKRNKIVLPRDVLRYMVQRHMPWRLLKEFTIVSDDNRFFRLDKDEQRALRTADEDTFWKNLEDIIAYIEFRYDIVGMQERCKLYRKLCVIWVDLGEVYISCLGFNDVGAFYFGRFLTK